jgi:hypothetical protein
LSVKNPAKDFPVVCVGGSAGGLDAYTQSQAGASILFCHLRKSPGKALALHGAYRELSEHRSLMPAVSIEPGPRMKPEASILPFLYVASVSRIQDARGPLQLATNALRRGHCQ